MQIKKKVLSPSGGCSEPGAKGARTRFQLASPLRLSQLGPVWWARPACLVALTPYRYQSPRSLPLTCHVTVGASLLLSGPLFGNEVVGLDIKHPSTSEHLCELVQHFPGWTELQL